MRNWIEFWDGDHAIYSGDRHKALNARWIARDIARFITRPNAVVLDFGCGEALEADALGRRCGRLLLCDGAGSVRAGLAERFKAHPRIAVIGPDALEGLADRSLDLVVVSSVLQYIDEQSLSGLLDTWRSKLKDDGKLVVADVIPPGVSKWRDAGSLLRFAWQGGFLLEAVAGLAKTACSDYGRLRKEVGFSMYGEGGFLDILGRHGFAGQRVYPNVGHNQARMTFLAEKSKSHAAALVLHAAE